MLTWQEALDQGISLARGTMFEEKYNDRIILPGMQCEDWKRYLDDNPRRLAIKQQQP